MWRVKVVAGGFAAVLAMSLVLASGASATNPCKPVKGVSPCVFGIQTTPGAEPEPLHVGQDIQLRLWGRGIQFSAGVYSFVCHEALFGGTVASFSGGGPVFATPTNSFIGTGAGGACNSALGPALVTADSTDWTVQLSLKESMPGQITMSDVLKTSTKQPVTIASVYTEAAASPVNCTWIAGSVKGAAPWVADEQIGGETTAQNFKLDRSASNSPLCPPSGKMKTSWQFSAAPPAGGLAPLVAAIG